MSPSIDFSNVKGLEPIPVGTYPATIVDAKEGTSQKGNTKIDLQWKVEGGPHDGRIVFDTFTFTEQSLFRVKNTMLALGFPKDFKGDVTAGLLVGKAAQIVVEIEQSTATDEDGEPYPPRNRVKKVKPISAKPRNK